MRFCVKSNLSCMKLMNFVCIQIKRIRAIKSNTSPATPNAIKLWKHLVALHNLTYSYWLRNSHVKYVRRMTNEFVYGTYYIFDWQKFLQFQIMIISKYYTQIIHLCYLFKKKKKMQMRSALQVKTKQFRCKFLNWKFELHALDARAVPHNARQLHQIQKCDE